MAGTFDERMAQLAEMVGDGDLTMKVSFPGPYAAAQHEGGWVSGPLAGHRIKRWTTGGTGPKFLQGPLTEGEAEYLERLAAGTLEEEGLERAMVRNAEDLADESSNRAPRLTGALEESPSIEVTSNGATIFEKRGPDEL